MIDLSILSTRVVMFSISTVVSAWLVYRVWRSNDPLVLKIGLTVVGFIPFIGPVVLIWTANFADPMPLVLRDQYRYRTDVFDRWHRVLREKNPARRFAMWRQVINEKVEKNDGVL